MWRKVADNLRPRWPKLAEPIDTGEHHMPVYMTFPKQHSTKLRSTNPIARLTSKSSGAPLSSA